MNIHIHIHNDSYIFTILDLVSHWQSWVVLYCFGFVIGANIVYRKFKKGSFENDPVLAMVAAVFYPFVGLFWLVLLPSLIAENRKVRSD